MTNSIFRNSLIAGLLMSFSLSISAEEIVTAEETMVIEIQGDSLEIHKTDLSHLATGESEIIYTESGKELTLTRTENGMEVFIDGKKVDTGPHLAKGECNLEVFVETDCEDCAMDLREMLILAAADSDEMDCTGINTEVEQSWVSADGTQRMFKHSSASSDGSLSSDVSSDDGEVRVIMIRKEVIKSSEEF